MKKILTIALSIMILLSTTACGTNAELEALRKENEELKQQLVSTQNPKSTPSATISPVNKSDISQYSSNVTTISFNFIDTSELTGFLCDGMYRCGTDFDAGDYYILSLYGAEAGYDVSNSTSNFPYERRIMKKIHAEKGQYIKLCNAILVPEDKLNLNDLSKYGIFIVGKDLQAGDYKMESIVNSYQNSSYGVNISGIKGAYQISEQSPFEDILDSDLLFDKQKYVSLENGQYLVINNTCLTRVDD